MNIIITGPSGSGKSSIIKKILKKLDLVLSVSYTTRLKRNYETDGIDYHFISIHDFKSKILNNELEEYTVFNGNYYGTPLLSNETKIYDLEYEGVLYFNSTKDNCLFIFIDIDQITMQERLRQRGSDEEDVVKRLSKYNQFQELKNLIKFDLVLDNSGDLSEAVNKLEKFLKERL